MFAFSFLSKHLQVRSDLSEFPHTDNTLKDDYALKNKLFFSEYQAFDKQERFHVRTSCCVICGVTVTGQETSNIKKAF